MMEIENLIKLVEAVSSSNLTGLKYEEDGISIQMTKKHDKVQVVQMAEQPETVVQPVPAVIKEEVVTIVEEEKAGNLVTSPLVGTFYAAPAEDAAPFVAIGDHVEKGQTLAIVEAMKLMNSIESDFTGTITEILVENGQIVEYGQPLFRIS